MFFLKRSHSMSASWNPNHHLRPSWFCGLFPEAFLDFLSQEFSLPYPNIPPLWFVSLFWYDSLSTYSYNYFHTSLTMPLTTWEHLVPVTRFLGTLQMLLGPRTKWDQHRCDALVLWWPLHRTAARAGETERMKASGPTPPQSTKALFSRTESTGSLPALPASQRGSIFTPSLFCLKPHTPASLSDWIKEELEIRDALK